MSRDEILAALRDSHAKMETALAGLTETHLVQPGAMGQWSVKDILSHLTAWEAEVVMRLAKLKAGKKIQSIVPADSDIDSLNAKWYKENKRRALDRVLADFRGVRQQLIRQVESMTDQQLTQPLPWAEANSITDMIAWNSYDHEPEHVAQIQAWRKKLGLAP